MKKNGVRSKLVKIGRSMKTKPKKILVAVAMYRQPAPATVSKLFGTMMDFPRHGLGIALDLQFTVATGVVQARERALRTVLDGGYEAVICVDDDMDWPLSAMDAALVEAGQPAGDFNPFVRLWARDKDVVGTLYTTRKTPLKILAGDEDADGLCRYMDDPARIAAAGCEPIDFFGFGMVMIRRRAILKMLELYPLEAIFQPWSNWRAMPGLEEELQSLLDAGAGREKVIECADKYIDRSTRMGEDFSFCKRAREAGCGVFLDTSFTMMHIGSYAYGVNDWLAVHQQIQAAESAAMG